MYYAQHYPGRYRFLNIDNFTHLQQNTSWKTTVVAGMDGRKQLFREHSPSLFRDDNISAGCDRNQKFPLLHSKIFFNEHLHWNFVVHIALPVECRRYGSVCQIYLFVVVATNGSEIYIFMHSGSWASGWHLSVKTTINSDNSESIIEENAFLQVYLLNRSMASSTSIVFLLAWAA